MANFLDVHPSAQNHWRALILFGRNVATYKFALGHALLRLGGQANDLLLLEDLALPFAKAICEHIEKAPKQATSASSRFLDQCRAFNVEKIDEGALRESAVRLGFNNVIDAFHRLGSDDVRRRFFVDERTTNKGIRITDDLRALIADGPAADLSLENEARWRLVETAWEIGVRRNLIEFDEDSQQLFASPNSRRISLTSCRHALNGYQKGHCFYCFQPTRVMETDVDHFFPWRLQRQLKNVNGVWNLVLACSRCNRGYRGKFDLIPDLPQLEKLHRRNEFMIASHHPLRETLMAQTGIAQSERLSFLNDTYRVAITSRIASWKPIETYEPVF